MRILLTESGRLLRYRFQAFEAFRTKLIPGINPCPLEIPLRHFKGIAH